MSLLLLFQNNLAASGSTTASISEPATSVEVSSAITVLLASISEAGSAVEVESAVQIFAASITEAGSATDVESATQLLVATILEAGNATEIESAIQIFAASITENNAAIESISAVQIVASSILESGSATEIATATQVLLAAIAESGISIDAQSAVLNTLSSISESGASIDTQSNVLIAIASIVESGTSTEVSSTLKTLQASILEAVTATDVESVLQIFVSAILESGVATDSESAAQVTSSSILESSTASEIDSAIQILGSSITEAGNATEIESALQISGALASDAATAIESQSTAQVSASAILESGTATEAESAAKVLGGSILEVGSAAEIEDALKISLAAISESTTATEVVSYGGAGSSTITESGTATEIESGLLITASAITESVAAVENESAGMQTLSTIAESVTIIDAEDAIVVRPTLISEVASITDLSSAIKILSAFINESINGSDTSNSSSLSIDSTSPGSVTYISQMTTEMFIEGRRVDISADISSLLTFAIDDIKDFASRQTTFSKTIVLPGTNNNNQLFGSIFETGICNDYNPLAANILSNFNASKSAKCMVFQDNLQTFKGTIRLLQISKDKHNIEYETALNGELTNLNVALSSKLLSNLDFSAYDNTYNQATITASWIATPGSGVLYPLIDYGQLSFYKHDWDIRAFRPALYVREYIDKMFTAAGYRFQCALFDTLRFKKLVVPHNKKLLTSFSNLLLNEVGTYGLGTPQTVLYSGTALSGKFAFNIFSGGSFTPDASPATRATYNVAGPTSALLVYNLSVQYFSDFATTFSIKKNGVDIYAQTLPSTGMTTANINLTNTVGIPISLSNTDYLEVWMTGPFAHNYTIKFTGGQFTVKTATAGSVPVVVGNTIVINDSIPANIRQVEFLTSIVKLFNLYVYEDKFDDRLILITPFPDFYSTNSSNAVDWTYKLNRDAPIKIKPLSEINSKIYNFSYKDDSDYWNELYKKRYNQSYGSYTFDSQFEFVSQTNQLELIFASTPLVGYPGEEKVVSSIYKSNNGVEENLDSVIRILQSKYVTGVASWDILDGPGTHLTTRTDYGYAGHLDDPNNPTNDINFGALKELFFTLVIGDLSKTQFNIYWSAYMAEITDKDSKMITARFYLTPKDIFDLDFSKYIVVDSVLYRVNKITDYNTSQPEDCEIELIKVINTIY